MTIVAIANALLDGVMRARFHAEPIVQATELLLQERTPRDVAVAHPRAEEVSAGATVQRSRADARASPAHVAYGASPSRAPALQRPLCGDADGGRLGLQPLARPRRHALARGHHPRRLGQLHLPARCRERRGLVGRLSAERRRAGQLRSHVRRGPRRVHRAATARSRPRSKSSSRRRTMPRSAACRSPTSAAGRARSSSRPMPSSCWRRRRPTPRIRPSRSCSCETEYRRR